MSRRLWGFEVELIEIDTREVSEDLLDRMYDFYEPIYMEELPDGSHSSRARMKRDWRSIQPDEAVPRWLLMDGDEIVGSAVGFYNLEQDLDNGFMKVNIRADHRRKGYGRKMAGPVLDRLEDAGRKRVSSYCKEGWSIGEYLVTLGMNPAYREKRSRLEIADVDRDEMQAWVDRAPERAGDYEMIPLAAPMPEDVIDRWCELQFQMNTAPQEDFEQDDWVFTPKTWRGVEETILGSEKGLDTRVVLHKRTGEWIGSTSIQTDRLDPAQAWQWETVVHPEHRNKGLGRWLKGALILDMIEVHPEMKRIDTWNAGSNEPMLNINYAMGFKTILVTNAYQGETAEVRRRLGV